MGNELVAALVGAGSAIVVQIIAGLLSSRQLRRQNELAALQLQHGQKQRLNELKIDAIVSVRNAIQSLADGDRNPLQTYDVVRPSLIFLPQVTEARIKRTIKACSDGDQNCDQAKLLTESLQTLKSDLNSIISGEN